MEQLLAIRDRVQNLEFETGNSVMELRLLVLSALNHIMRLRMVCRDASQRTVYKDAFRVLKHNYKFIEQAQGEDAQTFWSNRQRAMNGMDELLMQLCVLEAQTADVMLSLPPYQHYSLQLRIA